MVKSAVFILALATFATALPTEPIIDLTGSWKVVGGTNAAAGAYPFLVSLRTSSNSHFCGGTILNTGWVLTAAHCLVGSSTANVFVYAGSNQLNSGGVTIASSRLTVHGSYNPTTITNDVAVIRLASALTYSSTIAAVSLNTANTGAVPAILAGWGRVSTNGAIPNNLQQLSTNTITHATCLQYWGSLVSSSQICAVIRSGQGACNGDSGGPLLQASNNAQLGVTSFILSGGCAQGFPDVYARVSSYSSWISSAISS
ncbi:chymotrypsin-related [Holotrichia oblita]|uniref:Chymotrypsin-related n=3 Tax=Holotrichia oblita TaxID=644536 RepID=A0ACB9TSB0_HOLOL|nr:chymotrypsin-related [Holotrichia oblita]KAI4469688.1 chymotrypsin-related [Holotrichia oblita]KAI4469695.1 chymotrypsin-related [Holotrichia oblita]